MSNVVSLNDRPTVDTIMERLNAEHAAGRIKHILVGTINESGYLEVGLSQSSNERSIWMADTLLHRVREQQA